MKEFFCLGCGLKSDANGKLDHECDGSLALNVFQQNVKMSFIDRIYSVNWHYVTTWICAAIVNALLISHSSLGSKEQIIEGICVGFILSRVLK